MDRALQCMVSFHDWQNHQQWYSDVDEDSLQAWNGPSLDFAANNVASQTARGRCRTHTLATFETLRLKYRFPAVWVQ